MKESIIKSITEAFSMQPNYVQISTQEHYDRANEITRNNLVRKIVLENRQVATDRELSYYVGYSFTGERLFEYLQSSVNVHFLPETV